MLWCKQKYSFMLLVGKMLLIPSWQRTWSGSESPKWQTAEVVGGWEHTEEFMPILRGEKNNHQGLGKSIWQSHMFEISFLVISCSFFFSLECIRMCLGTEPCTKGYGGWERGV